MQIENQISQFLARHFAIEPYFAQRLVPFVFLSIGCIFLVFIAIFLAVVLGAPSSQTIDTATHTVPAPLREFHTTVPNDVAVNPNLAIPGQPCPAGQFVVAPTKYNPHPDKEGQCVTPIDPIGDLLKGGVTISHLFVLILLLPVAFIMLKIFKVRNPF